MIQISLKCTYSTRAERDRVFAVFQGPKLELVKFWLRYLISKNHSLVVKPFFYLRLSLCSNVYTIPLNVEPDDDGLIDCIQILQNLGVKWRQIFLSGDSVIRFFLRVYTEEYPFAIYHEGCEAPAFFCNAAYFRLPSDPNSLLWCWGYDVDELPLGTVFQYKPSSDMVWPNFQGITTPRCFHCGKELSPTELHSSQVLTQWSSLIPDVYMAYSEGG